MENRRSRSPYLVGKLGVGNVSLGKGSSALDDVEVGVDHKSGLGGHRVHRRVVCSLQSHLGAHLPVLHGGLRSAALSCGRRREEGKDD